MSIADEQTLRVLEFDKVLRLISSRAVTIPAKKRITDLRPLNDLKMIQKRLDLISDCRRLLQDGHLFGIEEIEDMDTLFRMLKPEEAVLDPQQLRMFIPLLRSAINLKALIQNAPPALLELLRRIHTHPDILGEIERTVEPDGRISDEASEALYSVRQRIRTVDRRIRETLERILRDRRLKPHIQDFYITERNGRKVIPVKADSKGQIPGVIHDISNTAETVFVEPYQTLQMGNELEALRAEEKVEEYRILKTLTAMLRQQRQSLKGDYDLVVEVDILHALASFAEEYQMTQPDIRPNSGILLKGARHPLLQATLRASTREEELVPLDLAITRPHRGMVITGVNAGGKTVALKTVGLFALMAMAGMHLPAEEVVFPPFTRVIADIGDEQSIEERLSTFSGHMLRLKEILDHAENNCLAIIDELGTGTDPDEGGALGCAILKHLLDRGAFFLASTHLGLLKLYAYQNPLILNGAMQVKTATVNGKSVFVPTYRLLVGEPGQSHALDIAKRCGLSDEIIEDARQFLRDKESLLEEALKRLRHSEELLQKRVRETERLKKEVEELRESLKAEIQEIKDRKRKVLRDAHKEAEAILLQAKREAEEVLKTIRDRSLQEGRRMVKRLLEEARLHSEKAQERPLLQRPDTLQMGQSVVVFPFGVVGTVTEVDEKTGRCRVQVKGKEIEVDRENLFIPEPDAESEESGRRSLEEIAPALSRELSLLGMRVDDALRLLERYLNDASLAGLDEVRIIHGAGRGRLREAVREYLRGHPLVRGFSPISHQDGIDRSTLVVLR